MIRPSPSFDREAAYILPLYFRSDISENGDMEFDPPSSFHVKHGNNVVIELGSVSEALFPSSNCDLTESF